MTARNEDFLFAQEAQNLGYVSEEQVEEGFLLQRRMSDDLKIDERLAVILVKRGWMADEQARRVYGIIEPEGARSRIEGYRLVQKVGRGAMGTVYKAIHKGLHRVVAIKILRRDLATDKTQIERLKREAQLLADLDHPNIVRAFDAGESNGFPYFVMEYVEGDTLREFITKKETLSNEEALRITRALADALEKARRMGIVHRDVKPGNILMSRSGVPKLMDLGLAKGPLDPGLTQHGATVGTPQFMSPEQAESPDKADTRSDIYSLGATLYAMVTGRPPFEGSTLAEIITKVMSQQPVPPRVRNPDVSPEVSHLIERMMLKDASLRYDTPAEVIADIDMIRGGQSIIPRGFQGNWEAFLLRKRFLRWRRRIVIGLAAALVLGVGGSLYWTRLKREEARMDVAQRETTILKLPAVAAEHDLQQLQQWLEVARQELKVIRRIEDAHEVAGQNRSEVEGRVTEFEHAVSVMKRYMVIKAQIDAHLKNRQFRAAYAAADRKAVGDFDDLLPAQTDLKKLRKRIVGESDATLRAAAAAERNESATTIPAFVKKWQDHAGVYETNWAPTDTWRSGGEQARTAAAKAAHIGETVAAFEDRYSEAVVDARVAALKIYRIKIDVRKDREKAAAEVEAHLQVWPKRLTDPRLLDENGIAALALSRAEERVDRAVRRLWEGIRDAALADPSKDNRERLRLFEGRVARGGNYPLIDEEAQALRLRLLKEYEVRQQESVALYNSARDGVLAALRRGMPEALEKRIDDALAERDRLTPAMRKSLQGLRSAGAILRQTQVAALTWLKANTDKRLGEVRVRGAGSLPIVYTRFIVAEVNTKAKAVVARVSRKGTSRKTEVAIGIGEFDVEHVLDWAQRSGEKLPPSAAAFVALAKLAPASDVPGRDLRKQRAAYAQVSQQFDAADGAWQRFMAELVKQLDDIQEQREESAGLALAEANNWFNKGGKHKVALELYADIADAAGRLRHTDAFRKSRDLITKRTTICREILAQQEMLRLFYGGVDVVETAGGRHIVTFDWDDLGQLKNLERGFVRAQTAHKTVTPDETAKSRELLLLPGVRGILRDRPLSLENLFDPNEEIVLEVRITVPARSSILAFDIDGVQIAICSADPNWWKRRFAEDVPLLDDEQKLPALDYYGMGRGIAFHEGKNFGMSFPLGNWDWSPRGAGHNFERWKRDYVTRNEATLFAFAPGRSYTVRIVRLRGQISLLVDDMDMPIVTRSKASWEQRGARSETNSKIRNGSGRIQILTWTPLVIDDLRLEGRISKHWKERRRRQMEKEAGK